jgi:hypothetical protein
MCNQVLLAPLLPLCPVAMWAAVDSGCRACDNAAWCAPDFKRGVQGLATGDLVIHLFDELHLHQIAPA